MIEEVKKAKKLKEQGMSTKDIEDEISISRNYIPKLIELYDEMSQVQLLDDKNSEYVRIKKKRYMMKSIKLQHRMSDLRNFYIDSLRVLKKKRKKIREYLDDQEEVVDLKRELYEKQKMLNVTSSNLQHAEDGYEYLKQEWNYNKAIYFIFGMGFTVFSFWVLGKFFAKVTIVFL